MQSSLMLNVILFTFSTISTMNEWHRNIFYLCYWKHCWIECHLTSRSSRSSSYCILIYSLKVKPHINPFDLTVLKCLCSFELILPKTNQIYSHLNNCTSRWKALKQISYQFVRNIGAIYNHAIYYIEIISLIYGTAISVKSCQFNELRYFFFIP